MVAPEASSPRRSRAHSAKQVWTPSPEAAAFAALIESRRLSAFDKLLLTILAGFCLARGNAFAMASSTELARRAGADGPKDGGEARVNRSLKKMESLGILERIAWYDLPEWMRSVGSRLGLADPAQRRGRFRRYLLLWWKVPGLGDGSSVALPGPVQAVDGARVYGRVPGAVDRLNRPAAPAGNRAPSTAVRTSSNSERLKPNGDVNVDAARARGGRGQPGPEAAAVEEPVPLPAAEPTRPAAATEPGPAAPTDPAGTLSPLDRERAARTILRECDSRRWTIGPDGSLEVMERFRGLVDGPEEKHREMVGKFLPEVLAIRFPGSAGCAPAGPTPAGPASATAPTTVDLLRRLASPCGPEAVDAAAVRLAEQLKDEHSLGYHRKRLAEVRDGTLPLKTVLAALESSAGAGVVTPAKIFTNFITSRVESGRVRR